MSQRTKSRFFQMLEKGAPAQPARPARRGRPPVTGTTRAKSLLLRLTDEERETLREAARRESLPLGAWARSTLLTEARRLSAPTPTGWARRPDGVSIVTLSDGTAVSTADGVTWQTVASPKPR